MYEDLYSENRGLLHTVARRYAAACQRDRAVSVEDLEQAGFFGLLKAAQSYKDDGEGVTWATWAARYISKEILNALGYRWQPSTEDDGEGCHYRPTRAHIGAYSLDAPISAEDPEGATWADTLVDDSLPDTDERVNLEALQRYVREAVERLRADRQRTVIQLCDLDGKPSTAAAEALGISTERVRQIRRAALKKLRADRQLCENARADIEARTPYYHHVGVTQFKCTNTSATERTVIWRIEHERRQQEWQEQLDKIEKALGGAERV